MYKVIVIEDEAMTRRGLIQTIPWQEHDCEVIGEAANGLDGIALAESLRPDIIITDIHMPEMDGLSMIERLKESTDAEFIVFSGYSQFEYAKKAISLGVHGYLLKPVDDDEFLKVLDETVASVYKNANYDSLLKELDRLTNAEGIHTGPLLKTGSATVKDRFVQSAKQYIEAHYNEELTAKIVADELNLSESYLTKLFRSNTGYSFLEYLTLFRVQTAMALLKQENRKAYEVAEMVGYQDAKYFSKIFRKIVGVNPTEFKNLS